MGGILRVNRSLWWLESPFTIELSVFSFVGTTLVAGFSRCSVAYFAEALRVQVKLLIDEFVVETNYRTNSRSLLFHGNFRRRTNVKGSKRKKRFYHYSEVFLLSFESGAEIEQASVP